MMIICYKFTNFFQNNITNFQINKKKNLYLLGGLLFGDSFSKGGGGSAATGGGLGLRTTAAIFRGLSLMNFNFALKNSNRPFFSHPILK